MFYIHFWTKAGELTRVPYESMEKAEEEAWRWERSEKARIISKEDQSFPGHIRDKMITVITDENNEICPVQFFGMGFIWSLNHNPHITNDNYWADRFEAASRGLTPGNVTCKPDCWNCANDVPVPIEENGKVIMPSGRDETIMRLFTSGKSRQEIANEMNMSYPNVCRIIREKRAVLV